MSNYITNKKWRKKHPKRWQATKSRYYKQFEANAHNRYQRWTLKEIDWILDKKYPDRDIASLLGRSVKAIQIKRMKLKAWSS